MSSEPGSLAVQCNAVQQSHVSSSKPSFINNEQLGSLLLKVGGHYNHESFILVIPRKSHRPCGLLVSLTYGMNSLATLRATLIFVLMHSGIGNGHPLLCNAHTVLEPHRGTAAFFFFTHYHPFPLVLFMCLSL